MSMEQRPSKVSKLSNEGFSVNNLQANKNSEDDDDDMFADDHPLDHVEHTRSVSTIVDSVLQNQVENPSKMLTISISSSSMNESMDRSCDDDERYYRVVSGTKFHSRFVLLKEVGRGAFGQVVLARDTQNVSLDSKQAHASSDVAIKILRASELTAASGRKEVSVLSKLMSSDPQDRHFCVRMLDHFEFRGHVCIVFEQLSLNLRQILDEYGIKHGKRVGISMDAVRVYGRQVFYALSLLESVGIVHGDLKPDNLLVSEDRRRVKLADFGTALYLADTAGGVSVEHGTRFYRAPEVILECTPVGYSIDVWALGCTMFEMFTGYVLFPGSTNNEMLKLMMDARGAVPRKFLARVNAGQRAVHFDEEKDVFLYHVLDAATKQVEIRPVFYSTQPQVSILDLLKRAMLDARDNRSAGSEAASKQLGFQVEWVDRRRQDEAEERQVLLLYQLIERCLTLDPKSRIRPAEALQHPFFASTSKPASKPTPRVVATQRN